MKWSRKEREKKKKRKTVRARLTYYEAVQRNFPPFKAKAKRRSEAFCVG
jgi:hypothetical protein